DAYRRRSIAARVGQVDGRFEAGDETTIAVRRWIRERGNRLRVLDDAADVVEGGLRKARVPVSREERLALLPKGLVARQARAVVTEEGLRHERRGLAMLSRDVFHDVLEPHQLIGAEQKAVELHADLALATGGHFVMADLDLDPGGLEREHDLLADVGQRVRGR